MSDNDTDVGSNEEYYEGSSGSEVVLAIVAAFLFGLLIRTVSGLVPRKWRAFALPFTAVMLICGMICGAIISNTSASDYMSQGLDSLESINPSVLFAVFMPALIVPSGFSLEYHTLDNVWLKAFTLAIPGTMINAALITLVAHYVFPYSWSWSQSFLFGSILSATDPVAVVSIMKSSGSSPVLTTVIECESLLNDGVAYVLFEVFLGWAMGNAVTASETVKFVFKASLGGPALGVAFAIAVGLWLQFIFNDPIAEITVTLTAAYSLWTLSDEVLSLSAVLAVLFFSMFFGLYGRNFVSSKSSKAFDFFWSWVDWVANTLIFFLAGLIIVAEISTQGENISGKDWGMAFSLYFLLIPIRIVGIIMLWPILCYGKYGLGLKDAIVLSWAGLRGAVGLTLALIVYNSDSISDERFRILCFFNVALIAALTLLIQGTTTNYLLKFLGYTKVLPTKRYIQMQSAEVIQHMAEKGIAAQRKRNGGILGPANWDFATELTTVNVRNIIEARGQRHATRNMVQEERYTIHQKELLRDLRERLLRAVASNYSIAFSQEYLTPGEIRGLSLSVEEALDTTDAPLSDWSKLFHQLDTSYLDISSSPKKSWKLKAARIRYKINKILSSRGGPLQSLAMRNSAITATFICAHAAARRQLKLFADLEISNLEQTVNLAKDSSSMMYSTDLSGMEQSSLGIKDDVEPYWDMNVLNAMYQHVSEAASKPSLTRSRSLIHHMATSDLMLPDDIKSILHIVMQESRNEQDEAEHFLTELKALNPEELLDVSTEFTSVDILRRQSKMLDFFLQLGLLEQSEVMYAQDLINSRMKKLHGHYHID